MSPVVLAPVSTAYCSLSRAPPPDSVRNQPVIVRLLVVLAATLESVSKFWAEADPRVVRLTHCAPAGRAAGRQRVSAARKMNGNRVARRIGSSGLGSSRAHGARQQFTIWAGRV